MEFRVLTSSAEVSPFVGQVNAIADQHREELGFLPHAAYEDLALKGQLWIALRVGDASVAGYLAFGGSGAAVKVSQLYVDTDSRRLGIGSALIGMLKEHAHAVHRQIVTARVASDLPANKFWEKQGFYVIRQVAGGKASGRTINVRVYDLPKASLLEAAADSPIADWLLGPLSDPLFRTPTYSLDLNVVFDVLHQRVDSELVEKLFAAAFGGDVRLCVSAEFMVELRRGARAPDADPLLKLAGALPMLPGVEDRALQQLTVELKEIVFPDRSIARRRAESDASDLIHLAACIYHRVRGFITRDRAILRAAPILGERFGIDVLSPFEVISPSGANPVAEVGSIGPCGAVELRSCLYEASHLADVRRLLTDLDVREAALQQLLEAGTTSHPRTRVLVYAADALVGFAAWGEPSLARATVSCFVVVRESAVEAPLVIDHFLGTILRILPERRISRCELWTTKPQLLTRDTARRVGFSRPIEGMNDLLGLVKRGYNGAIVPAQWALFAEDFRSAVGIPLSAHCPSFSEATSTGLLLGRESQSAKRAIDLYTFESELSPLLLLASGRPAVLVPIRDKQASQLLPSIRQQRPLFSKEAMSRIEGAYFGSFNITSLFYRGAIVVFYVSGAEGGRGEAVGMARVTSSGTGSPDQLHRDLIRQGVLTVEDLRQMAHASDEVSYFTFDSFIKFQRSVPFRELKDLGCISAANLVTSQALGFEKLLGLVGRAWSIGERR